MAQRSRKKKREKKEKASAVIRKHVRRQQSTSGIDQGSVAPQDTYMSSPGPEYAHRVLKLKTGWERERKRKRETGRKVKRGSQRQN